MGVGKLREGSKEINRRKVNKNVVYSKITFRFLKTRRKMQHIGISCLDFFLA